MHVKGNVASQYQQMYSYYGTLRSLKEVLLAGQALILLVRLIFQVLFTLPCSLLILQVLLASIIYCRKRCEHEAQFYILINFFLLYAFAYNQVFEHFCKDAAPTPLVENFKNDYKDWGYAIQSIFRIVGIVIVWRCYQYSKLELDEDEESDQL